MIGDKYKILTSEDVMNLLYISRSTLYKLLKEKKLRGYKIGFKWFIPRGEVERFIDQKLEHEERSR